MSSLEVTTVDVLDSIAVNNSVNAASVSATTVDVLDSITVNNSVNATSVSATTLSGNGASITSVTPADGTVTEAKLSNGAVTASKTASTIAKYADTTANFTGELQYGGVEVGYNSIPRSQYLTSSYTLTTSDVGKYIRIYNGGSVVIPDSVFSEGDVVVIVNTTTGDITITCNNTSAFIAGDNTNKGGGGTVTLATRGIANVLFINGTYCIISGNVS